MTGDPNHLLAPRLGYAPPPGVGVSYGSTGAGGGYGGYGGAPATGGAPTTGAGTQPQQPWDPNPDQGPIYVSENARGDNPVDIGNHGGDPNHPANSQLTAPAVAPYYGTSWEATAPQLEAVDRSMGGNGKLLDPQWASNPANFMYGRNPNQANADISRAQSMGQNATNMGAAWGSAGANYAQQQAGQIQGAADQAREGGLGMAQDVTTAGQYVNQVGMATAAGQRTIGDAQASTGASLGRGLSLQGSALGGDIRAQGADLGRGISALGGQAANLGTGYGANAVGVGAGAQRAGTQYGNSLMNVADRGLNAASLRADNLTGTASGYAQNLQGLEATEGPSGAQGLLNQQNNRAMGNQLALARSGRGMGGSAAAIAQAGQNIGALQQEAGNQAAMLRANENAAWRTRQAGNIAAAGQLDTGARATAMGGMNNAYGQAAGALAAGGGLDLEGRQTNLQGVTQGGALALQGAQANIGAAATGANIAQQGNIAGANIAQQGRIAGAGTQMDGLSGQAQTFGQAAGMQLQGAQSQADAAVNAAGVGQNAYGQGLAGYGQAAGVGMQGYEYGSGTQLAGMAQQQSYEEYAQRIRALEMTGGAGLEDKINQTYAIEMGQQQAKAAAKAQRDAAYLQAAGTAAGTAVDYMTMSG